jgi:ribonuclease G
MTKELFVSSTPHETKVGLVEDDQLAEVYQERENEYTLAGSIYKGRVTRVLPGMQSAFVDIGLERDAFLYVSDFMELQDHDEDLDEVPATRGVADVSAPPPAEPESTVAAEPETKTEPEAGSTTTPPANEGGREERERGWRGRRRRGRRDRFTRAGAQTESRPKREEYAPPPGYEPIILPGESISKYQHRAPSHTQESEVSTGIPSTPQENPAAISESFPQDEPFFARQQATGEGWEPAPRAEGAEAGARPDSRETRGSEPAPEVGPEEWEQEPTHLDEPNVAAGSGESRQETEAETKAVSGADLGGAPDSEASVNAQAPVPEQTFEEEEIEEEEADISAFVEELEEEAAFDEFEEETHAAGEPSVRITEDPSGESASTRANVVPFSPEPVSEETAEIEQSTEEVDEAAQEEAELEKAQAEAEALLAAEGNGTIDARAEVRAPASAAAYTQRAYRPADDRRRRGRRPAGRRFRRHEPSALPQITDLLKEGQEILVQIAKEPIGKKGARITSHIALPGRFLVYMPTVNHTGVSRKISSEEERQRLKRIIQSERENGHGGFIVRTAAQGADEDELRADIRFLKGLWNEIRTRAEASKSPALIYHDLNVVERILRDQVTSDFSAIWVDTEPEYERILRFANRFQPALVRRVKLYTKETPLFEQFGLKEEIDKALKSKVWLKNGGYIVINQTEALVAIDVNTGKYVGRTTRLEDTIVKTNVDAIKEIVRQIRLRDLGGIIVIDFIDMDERRNRHKVMQALEEALRSDRSPSKVLQFNDFGLVAITRKRVKQSLERTIGSPCPYCEATGFVKNVNTVCNEIYTEMRKIAKHLEHSDVMLRVNPEVAKALKANNGRWLNELEELTKKTVIVKSDPALHQERFDIN